MDVQERRAQSRLAGTAAIAGAVTMMAGAALWGSSGTDLWAALDGGDLATYLRDAGAVRDQLVANLSLWIVGTIVLGFAAGVVTDLPGRGSGFRRAARTCYYTGVPVVVASYMMMLVVVVRIAPDVSDTSLRIAEIVGWTAIRLDDLATALMIGIGPLFLALHGRHTWAPRWLLNWSYLTTVLGAFSIVVLYFPGMSKYGFPVIPVGVFWMLAAGIVLRRSGG